MQKSNDNPGGNCFVKCFVFLIVIAVVLTMTAFASASDGTVHRAVIGGCQYLSGFYPDFLYVKDLLKEDAFVRRGLLGLAKYYRVKSDDFVLYQCDFYTDKSGGDLFCIQEQWPDAYKYYHDGAHYHFLVRHMKYGDQAPVEISADLEMFGKLASEAQRSSWEDLHWMEIYSDKPETLALTETEKAEGTTYCLEAHTDDGRFVSSIVELMIYRGRLYHFIGHNGRTELTYYYPCNEAVQTYFTALLGNLEGWR
ncbi:MAG: hypothetical protein IJR97_07705 [Clostridia bacterium]|nr:hypothetical protein [Clostridia bacterium]